MRHVEVSKKVVVNLDPAPARARGGPRRGGGCGARSRAGPPARGRRRTSRRRRRAAPGRCRCWTSPCRGGCAARGSGARGGTPDGPPRRRRRRRAGREVPLEPGGDGHVAGVRAAVEERDAEALGWSRPRRRRRARPGTHQGQRQQVGRHDDQRVARVRRRRSTAARVDDPARRRRGTARARRRARRRAGRRPGRRRRPRCPSPRRGCARPRWSAAARRRRRRTGRSPCGCARRTSVIASAAAVPSSSSDALAVGSPVRSPTTVWKFSSASSRPCEISGWYGVYAVYQLGSSSTLRRITGGVMRAVVAEADHRLAPDGCARRAAQLAGDVLLGTASGGRAPRRADPAGYRGGHQGVERLVADDLEHPSTSRGVRPMWRSAKDGAVELGERGVVFTGAPRNGGVRNPPPLSAPSGRLQSCLSRTVLAPERFRGGIAPSALRPSRVTGGLSRAGWSARRTYPPNDDPPPRGRPASRSVRFSRRAGGAAGGELVAGHRLPRRPRCARWAGRRACPRSRARRRRSRCRRRPGRPGAGR